jgi:hypothetical protein
MTAFLLFLLNLLGLPFKSKSQLAAENAALRQQVIVLQRKVLGRVQLTDSDRLFFVQLYRWFPSAVTMVRPETLLRWHREGFRRYWRWKSRELRRTVTHLGGIAGVDPTHEPRKQALGSATHPLCVPITPSVLIER